MRVWGAIRATHMVPWAPCHRRLAVLRVECATHVHHRSRTTLWRMRVVGAPQLLVCLRCGHGDTFIAWTCLVAQNVVAVGQGHGRRSGQGSAG